MIREALQLLAASCVSHSMASLGSHNESKPLTHSRADVHVQGMLAKQGGTSCKYLAEVCWLS